MRTAEELEALRQAALRQPGGVERAGGMIKFQCPGCRVEGHDEHRDNAGLFPDGKWGCAVDKAHWRAIGEVLGAFTHNGRTGWAPADAEPDATQTDPAPLFEGLGTFLAKDFPPIEAYVEGLLNDEGGGWLGGEEKLGKSYYAVDEALCLALGLPVCGRFAVPQRRRVMFVEEEDPPRRVHGRSRALLRGHGLDPRDAGVQAELDQWFKIAVWRGIKLDDPVANEELTRAVATFKPAVVYFDALRKLSRRNLNHQDQAQALLDVLDDLRRQHGVLSRVIHHYRKLQGAFRTGRGSQEIGGSFVFGAWGECSLFFEPVGRKGAAVRVTVQVKDGPPLPDFLLTIEAEGPAFAPTLVRLSAKEVTPAAGTAPSEVDDQVYKAVESGPTTPAVKGPSPGVKGRDGVLQDTIVAMVKKSDKTVRDARDRLLDDKKLLVVGKLPKDASCMALRRRYPRSCSLVTAQITSGLPEDQP
jgi:AAA domain